MQCSQDCGGYRTRLVVCLIPQTKAVVSNDRCPSLGPRPPTTEFCQNKCKSAEVPHHSDHAHQSCKVILTMFSLPPPHPCILHIWVLGIFDSGLLDNPTPSTGCVEDIYPEFCQQYVKGTDLCLQDRYKQICCCSCGLTIIP